MVLEQTFLPVRCGSRTNKTGSWWAYNTPYESHQNDRDPESVQVWDSTVEDD